MVPIDQIVHQITITNKWLSINGSPDIQYPNPHSLYEINIPISSNIPIPIIINYDNPLSSPLSSGAVEARVELLAPWMLGGSVLGSTEASRGWGVPQPWGYPKWLVYLMENPNTKWMITGGSPYFRKPPCVYTL